jgi:dCMP deaminase
MSRKIGAILVRDKSIISTGYNGPAKGVKHCNERDVNFYLDLEKYTGMMLKDVFNKVDCPRKQFGYKSGQGLHLCQAGHAERNALIQAAKNGISTNNSTLYCWCPQVCKDCAIEIVNAGVKRLVYLQGPSYDGYADTILKESGIEITQIGENMI